MPWWIYAVFIGFITAVILFDLGVLNKKAHVVSVKEALAWTTLWVSLALSFIFVVFGLYEGWFFDDWVPASGLTGREASIQYLTAYLVEYSLSMDNIFVIAMIITSFNVPGEYQHRLLFWGILGAAVLRGVMIVGGAALIHNFEWIIYVFGALLIFSAIKMLRAGHEEVHPDGNMLVRFVRRVYPITNNFHGQKFFAYENGRRVGTPMLLALILIEGCDVMFAIDSIPAVFAVTRDPFIVFTSNIFAILGLRSLYFALAGMMQYFRYLKVSMVALLFYVGVKMLISHYYKIPNLVSLGIIATILAVGIIASLVARKETIEHEKHDEPPAH